MKIKKIVYIPEKKKWSIEIENENCLEKILVDEETIVVFELLQDKIISDEQYQEILTFEMLQANYHLAIRYLSRRRTVNEVHLFLKKKCKVEEPIINQILEKLIDQKYLDDEAYAKASIHDQMCFSKKSFSTAIRTIQEKGITDVFLLEDIKAWYLTNEILQQAERENLATFVQQQSKGNTHLNMYERKQRIVAKILQKGYNKKDAEHILAITMQEEEMSSYEKMRILEKSRMKIKEKTTISQYLLSMKKYNISKDELIVFFNQERMNQNDEKES